MGIPDSYTRGCGLRGLCRPDRVSCGVGSGADRACIGERARKAKSCTRSTAATPATATTGTAGSGTRLVRCAMNLAVSRPTSATRGRCRRTPTKVLSDAQAGRSLGVHQVDPGIAGRRQNPAAVPHHQREMTYAGRRIALSSRGVSMRRLLSGITAFGMTTLFATAVAAQTAPAAAPAQPPPPMTNLQLYPKDTPRPEIVATMQGFVQALGVQSAGGCGYCHVGTAPQFDFAADTKPTKNVARKMILMSREITGQASGRHRQAGGRDRSPSLRDLPSRRARSRSCCPTSSTEAAETRAAPPRRSSSTAICGSSTTALGLRLSEGALVARRAAAQQHEQAGRCAGGCSR